ncbi:hypothetical protein TVAGG3_0265070, partial [Trichomonas vaginalis G3]
VARTSRCYKQTSIETSNRRQIVLESIRVRSEGFI